VLSPGILARELTFQERVRAQEAIERVYYSHQVGATRPFEEAVPRALLERKVRAYLKQSAALEHFWKTPITAEMLRAEMARMNRQSRMPERLRELYLALDNDSFLIAECLARPALASRLVGNFFAFDERIHSATRHQAEAARAKAAPDKPLIVVEERDAFVLRERAPGSSGTAGADSHNMPPVAKRIPKTRLDAWWQEVEAGLDAGAVHSVGTTARAISFRARKPHPRRAA
jgi:hypothetical protein